MQTFNNNLNDEQTDNILLDVRCKTTHDKNMFERKKTLGLVKHVT